MLVIHGEFSGEISSSDLKLLVRITGSAVRTRGPITIQSASAYVMFSGAKTRNFQKKSQAFNMTRKQILKNCHGNPNNDLETIILYLFILLCVFDNQF